MSDSNSRKRVHLSVPGKIIDRIRVVLAGTGFDWQDYVRAAVKQRLAADEEKLKREMGSLPPAPPPEPDSDDGDNDDQAYDADQPVF